MVQGPLALEPRKCTFYALPLRIQRPPFRRLLLQPHFSQQSLMGTVNLNYGGSPVLLLNDPEHQITATVPIAGHDILRAYSRDNPKPLHGM